MAEDKPYQSLYRKYRPQGPTEVLGQEHVVRALMGAVREGRLAHAFLFTGPRGTGKTSTARILAKMVNCEQGPTSEPCGQCEQCVAVREGTHLDVVEIDAASHGGVDDARELREKAPTAPVQGREKVYIIDEAQRLSREAFDALLKVFEEPPPGVRFVLATTEPHKMPATIIGRCQRFDFRRIPADTIAELLEQVAKGEGLELTREAAIAIARATEGSARDAESLLDQASVLGGGTITEETVASLVGSGRSDLQFALADAISLGDAKTMFELVDRTVQEGHDIRVVTSASLTHFRNLLLARAAPDQGELLDVTEDEVERIRTQATKFTAPELSRVIGLLLAAQTDMRWTTSPRLTLELALIRSTIPETDTAPEGLVARLERLERIAGLVPGAATEQRSPSAMSEKRPATESRPEPPERPEADGGSHLGYVSEGVKRTSKHVRSAPSEPKEQLPDPTVHDTRSHLGFVGEGVRRSPKHTEQPDEAVPAAPVLGAGTSAIDVAAIRRSWASMIQTLRSQGKAVLPSFLETATPGSYDGETLELVFPPDRPFGVKKVTEREQELRAALQETFGIAPAIRCVLREGLDKVEVIEDDPPLSEEEALARIKAELGAQESES
ncbi:MAG: DNA polymerase III subunit gamma/tau [Actinomycetota bacterium]